MGCFPERELISEDEVSAEASSNNGRITKSEKRRSRRFRSVDDFVQLTATFSDFRAKSLDCFFAAENWFLKITYHFGFSGDVAYVTTELRSR